MATHSLSFLILIFSYSLGGYAYDLTLETCNSSRPGQRFEFTKVPGNYHPSTVNSTQIAMANGFENSYCEGLCMVNVVAWETSPGSQVWVKRLDAEEPIEHERNRIWEFDTASAPGRIVNPTSKL